MNMDKYLHESEFSLEEYNSYNLQNIIGSNNDLTPLYRELWVSLQAYFYSLFESYLLYFKLDDPFEESSVE